MDEELQGILGHFVQEDQRLKIMGILQELFTLCNFLIKE